MGTDLEKLDWDQIRSFVAVAETGSLTGAAEKLGLSQPTIGRHIKAIETALQAELFTRGLRGLTPTDLGLALLEPARKMAAAAARLRNTAMDRNPDLHGTVRLTASIVVSHYLLPGILADIRRQEPGIEIELLASDATENLTFREVDIAIRMYRPTQLDVVTRHIADQPIALYATHEFLAAHGQPANLEAVMTLPFVGFDKSELIIRAIRQMGHNIDRHFFGVRCDDQATYWELVCAGCGIGAMQTTIGDRDPRVERLAVQPALPALPIWLAAPEALRINARIRRVWDLLGDALSDLPR